MWQWWNGIISGEIQTRVNPTVAFLVEKSLQKHLGILTKDGALVVNSGGLTGRAVKDKYIVKNEASLYCIDWESDLPEMSEKTFNNIKVELLKRLHLLKPETYIIESSVGADPMYSMGVNFITTSSVHALFCKQIMREKKDHCALGPYTVYHDPDLDLDPKKFGLRSKTVVAINFKINEIVIGGTHYCGEIKKAIFTVMNTLLPDYGVLPMHAGASADSKGLVSVFFGLSGTGKTSLSNDSGMSIIGDDELGLSERGVFNFEGGCYAKTFELKASDEPQIYSATNRFGSIIENIVIDSVSREPDFSDKSITENGRSTYPLEYLENVMAGGRGEIPQNFFFLSADAMGVLPAISSLSDEQAMYYFLLGYTAKVGGTEVGMKGVTPVFSHCFGAPFMLRKPDDYGILMREFIKKHHINVWLVNTGWFGGPYGVGKRYDLSFTRSIIRAIQRGLVKQTIFSQDPVFSLMIPDNIEGIDSHFLRPHKLWQNEKEYFQAARELKKIFDHNYNKIRRGGPHVVSHQEDPSLY